MGSKNSIPQSTTQFITLDNFYHMGKSTNNNIYQSRLSSSSANKQLIHKTISYTESSQTVTRYLAMLQSLGSKVQCSNLYLPALCNVKPSDAVCTDYQTLNLFFQHYNIRIKYQIQARKKHREKFSQEQIWYILYSIVKAVRMFQRIGISSGNLKTQKILLNEKGHLKVINIMTFPEDSLNQLQQGYYSNSPVKRFFAPQQLRALRERIDKRINPNIAETFAIGIIVLQLATFISGDYFYDMQRMTLRDQQLKRADIILSQNYSKLMYNLVRTMLSGQYDRPLPSQIYSVFYPYQNRILTLKPFNFQQQNNMNNRAMNVSNASLMSL